MGNPDNFSLFFDFTIREEGGYVNNPSDRGGPTKYGITQATFSAYLAMNEKPGRAVQTLNLDEARTIYRTQYFNEIKGVCLPPWWAVLMGDSAVLCGPAHAIHWGQVVAGVPSDGVVGQQTIRALERANSKADVIAFCEARLTFHEVVATEDPGQRVFLQGWLGRVARLRQCALALLPEPKVS